MSALSSLPGKIVAVHTSYRSRAAERGTVPAWPIGPPFRSIRSLMSTRRTMRRGPKLSLRSIRMREALQPSNEA